MPARTRKIRHDDETRAKIQAAHLIKRFQDCFNGDLVLTREQISCGKLLLDKCLPDLSSVELSGEVETTNPVAVPRPQTYEEFLKYVGATTRPANGSDPNGKVH